MSLQVHSVLSFVSFHRSPARPGADRAFCQRVDMLLKAFASPCALLLGVLPDIVEGFFLRVFVHQSAVGGLARGRCVAIVSSVYCSCGVISGVCCPRGLWW